MTETVAEALARHEADCPVCQGNYREHCADRETDQLIAELRRDVERLTAERDAALERVKVVELRSAATPVDVERADDGDAIMRDFDEVAEMDPASILKVVALARDAFKNAIANFNACARLEAQVRDLTAERDEARAKVGEGWVPVGVRLPNESEAVLMWSANLGMYMGSRESDLWFADNGPLPEVTEVSHWMPLPQPPKET